MNALLSKALMGAAVVGAGVLAPQAASAATVGASAPTSVAASGDTDVQVKAPARRHHVPPTLGGFISCPKGTHPSPFEMPIYDDDGLFVVGYQTVWFCIPDDLEPAG